MKQSIQADRVVSVETVIAVVQLGTIPNFSHKHGSLMKLQSTIVNTTVNLYFIVDTYYFFNVKKNKKDPCLSLQFETKVFRQQSSVQTLLYQPEYLFYCRYLLDFIQLLF